MIGDRVCSQRLTAQEGKLSYDRQCMDWPAQGPDPVKASSVILRKETNKQ